MDYPYYYRALYRIRRFEETVLDNFPKGIFFGTTHTYLGQEANAVGVLSNIQPDDIVFSNHRCHGHFLAYGGDMHALFAELMGKETGICGGRGGSQHLHWRNFYSNGIQGGIVPIATGMALAEKWSGRDTLAIAFLGDGTLGEGVIYESFNLASLWQAPILFVLENNHIAQTTPTKIALSGDVSTRFEAFGIPTAELDSSDVSTISHTALQLMNEIRSNSRPYALILHTYRFGPHSKGDDTRPAAEVTKLRQKRDPLQFVLSNLNTEQKGKIEAEVNAEVKLAFESAIEDPFPQADYHTAHDARS